MHGVISSQPLGNERDLLRVKELSYEPRILVANEEHLYATQHVGPPKALARNLFLSPPSFMSSLMSSSIAWIPHLGLMSPIRHLGKRI